MIINKSGITIRISVDGLRVMGRATQGVKVIRLNDDDEISSVEKIEKIDTEEDLETEIEEGGAETETPDKEENGDNQN